jgi:hypothetical protein
MENIHLDMRERVLPYHSVRSSQAIRQEIKPTERQFPWTTSKCNRLLRPLVSKIAAMRKSQLLRDRPSEPNLTARPKRRKDRGQDAMSENESSEVDPDYRSSQASDESSDDENKDMYFPHGRRNQRTYGGRGKSIGKSRAPIKSAPIPGASVRPSDLEVPTPVSSRTIDSATLPISIGIAEAPLDKDSKLALCSNVWESLLSDSPSSSLLIGLKRVTEPWRWALFEQVCVNFIALLRMTENPVTTNPRGSGALLTACLKKVPEAIRLEEAWQRETMKDEPDISVSDLAHDITADIYTQLEGLGASAAEGWKSLRELVRSHGTCLVADAIKDRVFSPEMGQIVALLCAKRGAHSEVDILLPVLFEVARSPDQPEAISSNFFTSSVAITALHLSTSLARPSSYYRYLAAIFRDGTVDKEWLATNQMLSLWHSRIITAIAHESEYAQEAAQLLSTIISLNWTTSAQCVDQSICAIRPKSLGDLGAMPFHPSPPNTKSLSKFDSNEGDQSQRMKLEGPFRMTLLNLTNAIVGMVILSHQSEGSKERRDMATRPAAMEVISNISYDILQRFHISGIKEMERMPLTSQRSSCRLVGAVVIGIMVLNDHPTSEGSETSADLIDMIFVLATIIEHRVEGKKAQEPETTIFLELADSFCKVIQRCGRAADDDASRYAKAVVNLMVSFIKTHRMNTSVSPASLYSVGQMAIETAYAYADDVQVDYIHEWANEVEHSVMMFKIRRPTHIPESSSRTPRTHNAAPTPRYRWEEGISEWVTATPSAAFIRGPLSGNSGMPIGEKHTFLPRRQLFPRRFSHEVNYLLRANQPCLSPSATSYNSKADPLFSPAVSKISRKKRHRASRPLSATKTRQVVDKMETGPHNSQRRTIANNSDFLQRVPSKSRVSFTRVDETESDSSCSSDEDDVFNETELRLKRNIETLVPAESSDLKSEFKIIAPQLRATERYQYEDFTSISAARSGGKRKVIEYESSASAYDSEVSLAPSFHSKVMRNGNSSVWVGSPDTELSDSSSNSNLSDVGDSDKLARVVTRPFCGSNTDISSDHEVLTDPMPVSVVCRVEVPRAQAAVSRPKALKEVTNVLSNSWKVTKKRSDGGRKDDTNFFRAKRTCTSKETFQSGVNGVLPGFRKAGFMLQSKAGKYQRKSYPSISSSALSSQSGPAVKRHSLSSQAPRNASLAVDDTEESNWSADELDYGI